MTYQELVTKLDTICDSHDESLCEARLLFEHFLCISPSEIPLHIRDSFDSPELLCALERRQSHEPLAYILGNAFFWKQQYVVTPDCLIPRSDTEILVEQAIQGIPVNGHFADFCTGSGCIAISILCDRPDLSAIAVDLNPKTLAIAQINTNKYHLSDRCQLTCHNVLDIDFLKSLAPLDALVSNPPYIESATLDTLSPEVHREPEMALDGGKDGLDFYRVLINNSSLFMKQGAPMLFEIGFNQGDPVRELAEANHKLCKIVKDYNGLDRVAIMIDKK